MLSVLSVNFNLLKLENQLRNYNFKLYILKRKSRTFHLEALKRLYPVSSTNLFSCGPWSCIMFKILTYSLEVPGAVSFIKY